MVRRVVAAGGKSLAKSLAMSAAVLGPGFFLLASGQVVIGLIWLFAGSFGMLLWTYRRPWRLNWIACLMPPLAAFGCYAVQLAVLNRDLPPPVLLLGIILLGLVVGAYRGRAHHVYVADGSLMAQRTTGYLIAWAVTYGLTQFLSVVGSQAFLVQGGVMTGAFTTAMLATVSLLLFVRMRVVRESAR